MSADRAVQPPSETGVGTPRSMMVVELRGRVDALAERVERLETSAPSATLQPRVLPWLLACFGEEIAGDRMERGDRFLEEVFELLQSNGYDRERVAPLLDYVWNRPAGEPAQEVGGVMITLAAYCLAFGLDMHAAGETELARIWTKVEKIRAKQAAKPKHSPLPVASTLSLSRALTVILDQDTGSDLANQDIASLDDPQVTSRLRVGMSEGYFNQLRLHAARRPELLSKIAVHYRDKAGAVVPIGLSYDDELRWPEGFLMEGWDQSIEILRARQPSSPAAQHAPSALREEVTRLTAELASSQQEVERLSDSLGKAVVRLDILMGRMAGCDLETLTNQHQLSREEIPDWIAEHRAVLRSCERAPATDTETDNG